MPRIIFWTNYIAVRNTTGLTYEQALGLEVEDWIVLLGIVEAAEDARKREQANMAQQQKGMTGRR